MKIRDILTAFIALLILVLTVLSITDYVERREIQKCNILSARSFEQERSFVNAIDVAICKKHGILFSDGYVTLQGQYFIE